MQNAKIEQPMDIILGWEKIFGKCAQYHQFHHKLCCSDNNHNQNWYRKEEAKDRLAMQSCSVSGNHQLKIGVSDVKNRIILKYILPLISIKCHNRGYFLFGFKCRIYVEFV